MEQQGIMSLGGMGAPAPASEQSAPLFDPAASAAFESARQQINPREFNDELLNAAEDTDPVAVQQFRQALQGMQLPPEIIDALGQMVDAVLAEPQNYQEIRAEFIKEGVPEELLPPEFDAAYFGALNMALDQMSGSMMPMGVQGFAAGGIVQLNPIAQALASQGRNGDRILAHITPSEARMLRRRGGSGTINPVTGLPEFFFKSVAKAVGGVFKGAAKAVGSVVKGVAGAVKDFAKSSVGKVVTAVALGFFLGPAAAAQFGITSAAGVAAVSGFVGGFGSSLLAGQSLKDSLKSGALGGVTAGLTAGVTGGMNAFETNSYGGPTTISGQWDRAVESGKSLLGMPSAQPEVTGTISNVEVSPVQTPTTPTVTEIAGQTVPGPQDFVFDPVTGEQLLTPAVSTPVVAAPPALTTPLAPASQSFALPGGPQSFSFDPVTGEMLTSAAPIGPGTGITSLSTPSGDYLSTLDAQNLIATGGGVGPLPKPEIPLIDLNRATSLTTGAPVDGAFRSDIGLGPQPTSYTPNYLTGEAAAGGTGLPLRNVPGTAPSDFSMVGTARDQVGIGTLRNSAQAAGAPSGYFDTVGQQLRGGDIFGAAKTTYGQISPSAIKQRGLQAAERAYAETLTRTGKEALAMEAYKAALPGMAAQYGPIAATGIGAAYLGGAFNPPPEPEAPGIIPKETGFDLLAQSPEIYGTAPGGAATQYFAPQYMGYGLSSRQYRPPNFQFRAPEYRRTMFAAQGGIATLKKGGTPEFPRKNGAINGPGTETSDDIPAMLSDGEFVFTAKAVRGLGKGSRRLGAKRMYAMMKALEGKA
jgi:hypothetical protein